MNSTCLHRRVASGPWKLKHYDGFDSELFHMDEDPEEQRNLAQEASQSAVLSRLDARLVKLESPKSVLERVRKQRAVQPWIERAVNLGDVPLPDTPWFSELPGGISNRIDPR